MLKKILQLIKYLGVVLLTLSTHIIIKTILPFPLDHLNIVLLVMIWINIFNPDTILFELMIGPLLLLELFASTPFGLNAAALILSCFLMRWFVLNIFTNYSLYMVISVTFLNLVCYRIVWYGSTILINIFFTTPIFVTNEVLKQWFYELLITGSCMIIFYLITSFVTNYFKPHYIKKIGPSL